MGKVTRLLETWFCKRETQNHKESRNTLSWRGPTRILKVQLRDLHRIAPRITPCAWDSCDSVKHGLISPKIALKIAGMKNKKTLTLGQKKKKRINYI